MADDALTFLAVCHHGSFLAAGQALGVAPSTVARRLDQLEDRLGAKLFDRSTRGLSLTEAGALFRDHAGAAERALQDAEDAVRTLMTRPAGRLRVAAPSVLLKDALGPVALGYLRRFPDVSLELVGTDEDVVPDGTHLHLAIRASRGVPPDDLVQRRLGRIPMGVYASPSWISQHPPVTDPADLARHGCIVLGSTPAASRVRFSRGADERTLGVPIALFTTSVSMARRAAVAGLGPVGLPVASCADLESSGRLVPLLPDWALDPVDVVVLYAGGRQLPLRVRAFVDALVDAFAQVDN